MIEPVSVKCTPAIKLSKVDFPAPFPPIIVTKSPSSSVKSTVFIARFSVTVPGLNVFDMLKSFSIPYSSLIAKSYQGKRDFSIRLKCGAYLLLR